MVGAVVDPGPDWDAEASQGRHGGLLATELLRLKFEAETERAVKKTAGQAPAAAVKGLAPWSDVVQPHRDVQKGRYAQAEFAADLWQVHTGRAVALLAAGLGHAPRDYP